MERVSASLQGKIMSPHQAAQFIHSGMVLGMSGFTLVGYPKAIPAALVQSGHAKELTICIGASVGDDLDGALVRAGLVKKRCGYQANPDLRDAINNGSVGYEDIHISHYPMFVNQHVGPPIDIAIVECTLVDEKGLVPTGSVGCMDAVVRNAKGVLVEVNQTVPMEMKGIHDIYDIGVPPHCRPLPIETPRSRVGTSYVPCAPEKILGIVLSSLEDQPPRFKPVTPAVEQLGENVVAFLKEEIAAGRLPEKLGPLQSGVGSVGNAILNSLSASGFQGLEMYTEVMQDAGLKLLESGVISWVSASAISLEAQTRRLFYQKIRDYKERIILRPQEISNNPGLIRQLGVVAINTPVEVDIYGNVNSTHLMGSRMINGIGGSGDFTRNARLSIFATESLAKGGRVSCLVPMVSHVDHTEHDVQVVITEQGVADLRWRTPVERARLLIERCAHPDYRELLWDYFQRAQKGVSGRHTPHLLGEALSWHQRFLKTGTMQPE